MSLRRRLFLPVVTALLPIIAIEAYNQIELHATREREVQKSAVDQARRVAAEQERIVDGVRNVLSTLTVLKSVRAQEPARCNGLFAAILPTFEGFESLVATRADGTPFCAARATGSKASGPAPSVGDRSFFKEATKERALAVGGYARAFGSGIPVMHIAVPYFDYGNHLRGVVYVGYKLATLAKHLSQSQQVKGETLSVIDRSGTILVQEPGQAGDVGHPVSNDIQARLAKANAPFHVVARSPRDGVTRVYGVIPPTLNAGGFSIRIGLNREAAFASLNSANTRQFLVIAGGTLLAFLLAWLIGLHLVRAPIEGLLETTRRWRHGDLSARTGLSGPTELGQLGEAFDAMAGDLQQAIQVKDMLLRELNHRVMNSLQTISALFSLQARSLNDPDAHSQFSDAVSRINSIALAYRRMHASEGAETIDLAEFLTELCADIGNSLMPEGNACRVESESLLLGSQEASSLALIVNELLTNAIKYGRKGSPIDVTLAKVDGAYRLSIRNEGTLPSDYNIEDQSGFGIRMVRMLADRMGGWLEVASTAGYTEFSVTFKPPPSGSSQAAVSKVRTHPDDDATVDKVPSNGQLPA